MFLHLETAAPDHPLGESFLRTLFPNCGFNFVIFLFGFKGTLSLLDMLSHLFFGGKQSANKRRVPHKCLLCSAGNVGISLGVPLEEANFSAGHPISHSREG